MSGETLTDWIGRTRSSTDLLAPFPARAMCALLDRDPAALDTGAALPDGWHWLYFHEPAPSSALGADGHERRGDFLPPVPLPRRMWAGGRLQFGPPLRLGQMAWRRSTIQTVEEKIGRSGPLVFVTVGHEVSVAEGPSVREEQDLVYRDPVPGEVPPRAPAGGAAPPADARSIGSFATDPVALFRFSALTFNGHRIHYDQPYATGVEGYPGLVVHGPLLALLLLDGARRVARQTSATATVTRFSYRALSPVFCGERVLLHAREMDGDSHTLELWAGTDRSSAMAATAEFALAPPQRTWLT
ncbi:MAG: MaoC family dehydratase N-terminal domain-containing protein [Gemmatimonadota bacterium]